MITDSVMTPTTTSLRQNNITRFTFFFTAYINDRQTVHIKTFIFHHKSLIRRTRISIKKDCQPSDNVILTRVPYQRKQISDTFYFQSNV